eukprot:TRINITY_DN63958_c0_g1_i1.p1 TRINITY_DN63958_c0_g1~~TRINITY_DN63958_c0_g1_i1.p1  ORF type:complete len:350 (+),score=68.37 TRINITY_DN63958_c0_g1_i1:68-1117(+)
MTTVSLDAFDGGLVGLVVDFLDRDCIGASLMPVSRLCFSTACSHKVAYRTPMAEWRASALGAMFEHDKRMGRAVSLAECIASAHRAAMEEAPVAERLENIALRTQMVSALESAVGAAARHADECARANAALQRHAGKLSRFLAWLKLQRPALLKMQATGAKPDDAMLQQHRFACQEMEEFGRRLALLLRTSQTLAALLGGTNGTMARHKRLYKVVRLARLAQPEAWANNMQAQCEEIHDVWRYAVRKLDAIVCSVRMRGVAFVDMACGCTDPGVLAAAVSAIGAEDAAAAASGEEDSERLNAARGESTAKLDVLTAIAALAAGQPTASSPRRGERQEREAGSSGARSCA